MSLCLSRAWLGKKIFGYPGIPSGILYYFLLYHLFIYHLYAITILYYRFPLGIPSGIKCTKKPFVFLTISLECVDARSCRFFGLKRSKIQKNGLETARMRKFSKTCHRHRLPTFWPRYDWARHDWANKLLEKISGCP